MRESGTEGISALLSDVMNIKNGSELYFLKMSKFWSKNIFAKNLFFCKKMFLDRGWDIKNKSEFLSYFCNVACSENF